MSDVNDAYAADAAALPDAGDSHPIPPAPAPASDSDGDGDGTQVGDAVERAFDTVDRMDAAGTLAGQPGQPGAAPDATHTPPHIPPNIDEAPARFSEAAKVAWQDAPESVKAEVHRAVVEMEAGIEKYREAADNWADLADFEALAQQHGVTIRDTLSRYVAADQMLNQDLIGGLEQVVALYGYNIDDVAQAILQRGPSTAQGTAQAAPSREVQELRGQVASLAQQLNAVGQTVEGQSLAAVESEVASFADAHPRFDELADEIKTQIELGFDLPEAYRRADRLIPGSAAASPYPSAQTRKGSLSVTGAPSSGSNPAHRKPPSSAGEAVDRAFAQLGLG